MISPIKHILFISNRQVEKHTLLDYVKHTIRQSLWLVFLRIKVVVQIHKMMLLRALFLIGDVTMGSCIYILHITNYNKATVKRLESDVYKLTVVSSGRSVVGSTWMWYKIPWKRIVKETTTWMQVQGREECHQKAKRDSKMPRQRSNWMSTQCITEQCSL